MTNLRVIAELNIIYPLNLTPNLELKLVNLYTDDGEWENAEEKQKFKKCGVP